MKNWFAFSFFTLCLILGLSQGVWAAGSPMKNHSRKTDAAQELIRRVTRDSSFPVSLKISKQGNNTYYRYAVNNGKLSIIGLIMCHCAVVSMIIKKNNGWGLYT